MDRATKRTQRRGRLLAAAVLGAALAVPVAGGSAAPAGLAIDPARLSPDDWAYDTVQFLADAGARVEVPRLANGTPMTRYQVAIVARRLLLQVDTDFQKVEERLKAEPGLALRDAFPPHLQSERHLARWSAERLQDPSYEATVLEEAAQPEVKRERAPFPDVPAAHPAAPAVLFLAERGVLTGHPDGAFRGDQPLAPREFALGVRRVAQCIRGRRF
jgi:hypothetical protein